jgi:hypothetical protein
MKKMEEFRNKSFFIVILWRCRKEEKYGELNSVGFIA